MSEIQAVRFNKKLWTHKRAERWLYEYGYHHILLTESKNYYRYRIHPPNQFDHFITKKEPHGIELIIGFHRHLKTKKHLDKI
jgi:hypothetical protein